MIQSLEKHLTTLRQKKPVILNLTNYVTMDFVANSLLALGAAPVMSVCSEELEALISIASALYINIGTLDSSWIEQSVLAANLAKKQGKPLILDPVGAGASQIRTQAAQRLMPYASVIKGNASEMMALVNVGQGAHGVESVHGVEEAREVVAAFAGRQSSVFVVSGSVDWIICADKQTCVPYGSALMSRVTGMGCALGAVIAAFRSVMEHAFEACQIAVHYFALCGELAARYAQYPASFRTQFIDQLYASDFSQMRKVLEEGRYAV